MAIQHGTAQRAAFKLDLIKEVTKIKRKIAVIGLGYVGLMIATAFARNVRVIGFDISSTRINELQEGKDINNELSANELKNINIHYTIDPSELEESDFYIIAVPTPLDQSTKHPDLSILLAASKLVGHHLKKGDIIVYESSVYPGVTDEQCIPILENASNLICGKDFGVGYSPERINPADKDHPLSSIPKIVSAINQSTLDVIANVYNNIIEAGTYKVSSIKAAEAIKVVENIQRDLNISLVNEVALILHSLEINSKEVFDAMQTKWNSLPFRPGLVGGHCIPVNSYYLAHKAQEAGYYPEVILAGRRTNEKMPKMIAETVIKELINLDIKVKGAHIAVLGLTYKENVSDVHDTKVIDLIKELKKYDTKVVVHDPIADAVTVKKIYGIDLQPFEDLTDFDAVIIAVAHHHFVELSPDKLKKILKDKGLILDLKGILNSKDYKDTNFTIWRL